MPNELTRPTEAGVSALDALAAEARLYRASIDMSMYQLARVFIQAKELVPHGAWGQWLKDNADVSIRTAQDMMAVYRRFGDRPAFENVGRAKLFRMLSLPEGTEDSFMQDNNVDSMSAREVSAAVSRIREEAQAEIERERAARIRAEQRADRAEEREPEIPRELLDQLEQGRADLREAQENAQHFAETARRVASEKAELERANRRLASELNDSQSLLQEQQDALNQAQAELLDLQSAAARNDPTDLGDTELTEQALGAAVREFIGACARVPYMASTFAAMPQRDKTAWLDLVKTVEGWCAGARQALQSIAVEGVTVNG